jgi:DNA-directed RNA polymerase beta subunit
MAQTQQTFTGRKRVRKFFGHIKEVAEMPNLIEVQKASYDQFLMVDEPAGGRLDEGLQAVFRRFSRSTTFRAPRSSSSSATNSNSRSTTSTSAASAA